MSAMSELHADLTRAGLRPTRASQAAIGAALRDIVSRALIAEQSPDLDAMRLAVRDVRDACLRAWETINAVEAETRAIAEQKDAA